MYGDPQFLYAVGASHLMLYVCSTMLLLTTQLLLALHNSIHSGVSWRSLGRYLMQNLEIWNPFVVEKLLLVCWLQMHDQASLC